MASFKDLSDGLTIFGKYCEWGMHSNEMYADNGEIFFYISQKDLPPSSEDGKKLQELGFQPHEGHKPNNGKNWSIFVL